MAKTKKDLIKEFTLSDLDLGGMGYASMWNDGSVCLDADFTVEQLEVVLTRMKAVKNAPD